MLFLPHIFATKSVHNTMTKWIQLSRQLPLSLLLLLATIGSHAARGEDTQSPAEEALGPATLCPNKFDIRKNSKTLQALYCSSSNVDLSSSNNEDETITHAIFLFHSLSRNARDYIDYAELALSLTNQDEDETIAIVAPQFVTDQDISEQDSDLLYWSFAGWIKGNTSQKDPYDRPFTMSSFAVADLMMETVVDMYPNLAKITVFGYSAGGQWVHRYAAGSSFECSDRIHVQYVVSSPSSYMYFSEERPISNSLERFSVPNEAYCPGYNEYKYGLDGLNKYMADIGSSTLEANYKSRNVVIFLGDKDTSRDEMFFDDSCSADLQGYNRVDRGLAFWHHAMQVFGDGQRRRHTLKVAPGVDHNAEDMIQSPCGLLLLFDYDPTNDACPDYTFNNDSELVASPATSFVDANPPTSEDSAEGSDTIVEADSFDNYQPIALNYWTLVLDMVRADKDDAKSLYRDHIAPLQSSGIDWQIQDGNDITEYSGTEAVQNYLVESRETIESLLALNDDPQRMHWSKIHRPGGDIAITATYRGDNGDTSLQATVNFKTQGSRQGLITMVIIELDP